MFLNKSENFYIEYGPVIERLSVEDMVQFKDKYYG